MNSKRFFYQLLYHLPYFGHKLRLLDSSKFEPGHFYSTVPSMNEILADENRIFNRDVSAVAGIDLNLKEQEQLLESFKNYYRNIPYDFSNASDSNEKVRYKVKDAAYRYSDVIMLYSIIRHFQPKNIVEVGSGYSSAVMLDTNDLFLDNKTHMNFIDPDTTRLEMLMRPDDRNKHTIHKKRVQDVDTAIFSKLEENDILFIDSSHVLKSGSDLNYLMFEVLPLLKKGVLVHFHDIFFPFEMPRKWIVDYKWFWNENYALRAFLMYNQEFKIINFNTYLHQVKRKWFEENMSECLIGMEETGSVWLEKKSWVMGHGS